MQLVAQQRIYHRETHLHALHVRAVAGLCFRMRYFRFQQPFPKVEPDVRISERFVDLVEKGIDVALRVGELEDSTMIARRLFYCHFQVYGGPNNVRDMGFRTTRMNSESTTASFTRKSKTGYMDFQRQPYIAKFGLFLAFPIYIA